MKCNVIYVDLDKPPLRIKCEREQGHPGAHKGYDEKRECGAAWTTHRRLKVYEGQTPDDVIA